MDSNPEQERGPGLLSQLALRQEEYRGLLQALKAGDDKSFAEGVTLSQIKETGEDEVIALCTVLFELSSDPLREPSESDVMWALEVVDHLDTLGFTVTRKWHAPDGHNRGKGQLGNGS